MSEGNSGRRRDQPKAQIKIPEFINVAPFYMKKTDSDEQDSSSTLDHQKHVEKKKITSLTESIELMKKKSDAEKNQKKVIVKSKFKKGSCENCGSMDHSTRDCLERPRALNAKVLDESYQEIILNENKEELFEIQSELKKDREISYDEKRDRWMNYDPETQIQMIKDWEELEQAKLVQRKQINLEDRRQEVINSDFDSELDILTDTDSDDSTAGYINQKTPNYQSKSLRMREDTAKYLLNIHSDSAFYDPKSRSMKDNPDAKSFLSKRKIETNYAGDNFVRSQGQSKNMTDVMQFAWDIQKKGVNVNLTADPTRTEKLHKQYAEKQKEVKQKISQKLVNKYGAQNYQNRDD